MKDKPKLSLDTIKRMEDMTWFTHAQIFDDLLIVAQKETACYIWRTSEGLVVFDGIWPDERVYDELINAIEEVGWSSDPIKSFFITHGHIDHVGCGKWLVTNNKVKTFLSKADDELRHSIPPEDGRSDCWKDFNIDCYLHDGDIIECGDKNIFVVSTPGHTSGCVSFFFPVYDCGKKHIAGLFGGATAPWDDEEGKKTQIESVTKFMQIAKIKHCDVALTNHLAFDNGLERIAYSQLRMSHMPNIYILGEEGVQKFCEVYHKIAM